VVDKQKFKARSFRARASLMSATRGFFHIVIVIEQASEHASIERASIERASIERASIERVSIER